MFPFYKIRNIRTFYILSALTNCWFIAGNWIFFWTKFMTFGQLGIMDATCFAFGLLMEIPTGAISDIIGKKKTVVSGLFLSAIATLTMAGSNSIQMLWVAFLIAQLGWALYSGAAEALAYDTLVEEKNENDFDKVISTSSSISIITTIVTTLVGGLLYALHFRLSHLAWGLTYALGFLFSLGLVEPTIDTDKFSLRLYVQKLIDGMKQLTKNSLKPFFVIIFALLGAEYLYNWGLVKPAIATSFGFLAKEQAILFAAFGILGVILAKNMPYFRKIVSDKAGLYFLSLIMGIGFLISSLSWKIRSHPNAPNCNKRPARFSMDVSGSK